MSIIKSLFCFFGGKYSFPYLNGFLLFSLIILSISSGLTNFIPEVLAGIVSWVVGFLLLWRIRGLQLFQVLFMLFFGFTGIFFGVLNGNGAQYIKQGLTANHALIAMLLSVSFLRILTCIGTLDKERMPIGKKAMWNNLLGVHAFSAVISYSAVMLMGERLVGKKGLSAIQAKTLSRGFCMAANWSPFFAAMGVALSNAPGSNLTTLVAVGIPCTIIALLIAGWDICRSNLVSETHFYPIQFKSIWIPSLLAVVVLISHYNFPEIPVLTLISIICLALPLTFLFFGLGDISKLSFSKHIREGLPNMAGETLLFLSAGVLAAGISSTIYSSGINFEMESFGASEASFFLLISVFLSILGIHPVISIASVGSTLAPLAIDQNLLGITFLMSWALGVVVSPYSGIHLAMQGRFKINSFLFLRWNWKFASLILILNVCILHIYEYYSINN